MKKFKFEEYIEWMEKELKYFILTFRENDIKWWTYAGTTLGEVREGGMIPWDDDVDMTMPAKEFFNRKEDISNICESRGWHLRSKWSNPGLAHSKIIYNEKFLIIYKGKEYLFRPFIDIFLATRVKRQSKFLNKFWNYENILLDIYAIPPKMIQTKKGMVKINVFYEYTILTLMWILRLTLMPAWLIKGQQNLRVKIAEIMKKKSPLVANHCRTCKREIFYDETNIIWFKDKSGFEYPLNENYEEELTIMYGDWRKRPDVEEQKPKHMRYSKDDKVKMDPHFYR